MFQHGGCSRVALDTLQWKITETTLLYQSRIRFNLFVIKLCLGHPLCKMFYFSTAHQLVDRTCN